MIFGNPPDPVSGGNYPPELDQLRGTLRASLPKQEWPSIDRIHHALIQITRGSRMSTDTEMFRVQILTTVEAIKSLNKDTKTILKDFEESLASRLRTDLRTDFQKETIDCFRRADVARIGIRWWPMLLFGLIAGVLGGVIGRQTQPDRDFYFMMRRIGDDTLTFKASPKPNGADLSSSKSAPSAPAIVEFPDQESPADNGLESLQNDLNQRLKNVQQRRR